MKEELIKEFEENTGEKRPPVISTVAYHSNAHDRWVEAFTNWLIAVIADLEQKNIKLAGDYLTAVTQKIIAQEKYDKLNQRIKEEL